MGKTIVLSKKSQELLKRYMAFGYLQIGCEPSFASPVDAHVLVTWLSDVITAPTHALNESHKDIDFILASLRAQLLQDLLLSMDIGCDSNKEELPPSNATLLKFYLLAASGTVLAACEGFDSISSLLGVLAMPPVVTLLAALAFSALSVMVFYGFDLVQVSKNLGVKLTDAPKLLDLYLLQMREIKSIRKKINTFKLSDLSTEELEHLTEIITMLQIRFDSLVASSKQFALALDSPKMNFTKNVFVGIAGLLFFGGGFFAGQSVALFLLAMVMPSVTATFLPVVLFSVAVGLASFSLYWYIEKVGLQQLISGWYGLDEEKIETLCNPEELDKQAKKLSNLKEKIMSTAELTQQLDALKQRCEGKSTIQKPSSPEPIMSACTKKNTNNIYSFYQQSTRNNKENISVENSVPILEKPSYLSMLTSVGYL